MYCIGQKTVGRLQCIKGSRRDINDMSPIIDDGEKVEKKSESSAMCIKCAEVRQMVGSVLADRRRLVKKALPISKNSNTPPIYLVVLTWR